MYIINSTDIGVCINMIDAVYVDMRKKIKLRKFCSEYYHLTTEAQKLLACTVPGKEKKTVVLPLLNMFLSCTFSFALALHVQKLCVLLKPNILSSFRCLPSCPHFFLLLYLQICAQSKCYDDRCMVRVFERYHCRYWVSRTDNI